MVNIQINKKEIKSILIIRSAPLFSVFDAIDKLRKDYPEAKISILTQPEVEDEIKKSGLVDKVILGKSGKISILRYTPLISKLRRERFDLLAVIYSNPCVGWYRNVRVFSLLIKANKRIGIMRDATIRGQFMPFSLRETIFKELILGFFGYSLVRVIAGVIIIPLILILIICLPFQYLINLIKKR